MYSDRFINTEWCYGDFEDSLSALGEIPACIHSQQLEFWYSFATEFVLKLLDNNKYDLAAVDTRIPLTPFRLDHVVHQIIRHLIDADDDEKLQLLYDRIESNTGLSLTRIVVNVTNAGFS